MPKGIYIRKPRKGKIRKFCKICGKDFFAFPYTKERKKFCSNLCRHKGIAEFFKGNKSHFWKDGRSQNKKYIIWEKNRRNHLKRIQNINKSSHTFGEWENLKKQYNFICPSCKKSEPEIKLTQDHIIPFSKGGGDMIENIQPLCLPCNMKKHSKIIKYIQ